MYFRQDCCQGYCHISVTFKDSEQSVNKTIRQKYILIIPKRQNRNPHRSADPQGQDLTERTTGWEMTKDGDRRLPSEWVQVPKNIHPFLFCWNSEEVSHTHKLNFWPRPCNKRPTPCLPKRLSVQREFASVMPDICAKAGNAGQGF